MQASNEFINWGPKDDKSEVSIYLQCDSDNCHTAYKTTKAFLGVYRDRAAFEKKIFEAVADALFTDHGYALYMNSDGSLSLNGLIG